MKRIVKKHSIEKIKKETAKCVFLFFIWIVVFLFGFYIFEIKNKSFQLNNNDFKIFKIWKIKRKN